MEEGSINLSQFPLIKIPYLMVLWAGSGMSAPNCTLYSDIDYCEATLGPSLGPVIAGYSVQAKDWRWPQWELLWLSGPIFLFMFFSLPETSAATILYQRARRIRKALSLTDLKSQSEIDQEHLNYKEVAFDALISKYKPPRTSKPVLPDADYPQNPGRSMLLIQLFCFQPSIVSTSRNSVCIN